MGRYKEHSKKECTKLLVDKVMFLQNSPFKDKMPKGEIFVSYIDRDKGCFRFIVIVGACSRYADVNIKTGEIEWLY